MLDFQDSLRLSFQSQKQSIKIIGLLALLVSCCCLVVTGYTTAVSSPKIALSSSRIMVTMFAEPLVCAGEVHPEQTRALQQALQGLHPDRLTSLESYLKAYPRSSWRGSIWLNLGLIYRRSGYSRRSLGAFQKAWDSLRASTEPDAKALADRAFGEYCMTLSYLGKYEVLEHLLKQAGSRTFSGSSTESIACAREALQSMKQMPQRSFRCGPLALNKLCRSYPFGKQDLARKAAVLIDQCLSTNKGTSLEIVFRLSQRCHMGYQMAFRSPGSPVMTASVLHWKVGHFAAVLKKEGNRYLIEDSTCIYTPMYVSPECLDEEASGYCLIPSGPLPPGWRKVPASEARGVWGGGVTPYIDLASTTTQDVQSFPPVTTSRCMTTWNVHSLVAGLTLQDTPVGLSPAAFSIPFTVNYAHREHTQPAILSWSNLGPKWGCNWLAHVDNISTRGDGKAELLEAGGGSQVYQFPLVDNPPQGVSGLRWKSVSLPGSLTAGILTRIPDPNDPNDNYSASFVREMPDGSREIFSKRIGARNFLTERIDAQGNSTKIVFDNQNRISAIVDPVGRATMVSYELTEDPLKITKVTDPYGRSAVFGYTNGKLSSVTDVIGITSSYEYGPTVPGFGGDDGTFIRGLTTPYGTTTFTSEYRAQSFLAGGWRVFTATDPAGRTYRAESRSAVPGVPVSETAPEGIPSLYNANLQHRNAYSWTPAQLAGGVDYAKATVRHFMHRSSGVEASRLLESVKKPLENRVWYFYKDQVSATVEAVGMWPLRTHVGRVLGDGTTQLNIYDYNDHGNVVQRTDEVGRIFQYQYAPNGIDLLSVTTGGQALMSATYDANHNILSVTGASGASSTFTYNSRGQVETATNELNETTTYGYTPTGNLSSIQSPLNTITTFGYNGLEQLVSATDSEGYTVTAQYDAADRPVSVSFPDGTTETITYDKLDVASTKDRKDRVTTLQHDAVRRLTQVLDANGGTTTLGYGLEDSPNLLTDPSGRQTAFAFDLQQRLITKQYAGGATQTIDYQNCCGRLRTITDALGKVKTFSYFLDDTLKTIDYSGTTPDVNFTNDPFLPRPLSMTDGQGTTQYSYVPVGSPGANGLASITGPLGDSGQFQYDLAGRMTGRTVNGASETQNFDALWRTTSTTNALDTFNMSYLGTTGQVTGVNSTLGPSMQYTYGTNIADRRLAQIKNLGRLGQVHSQFDFTTNPVGEITRIVETHGTVGGTPTPTPTNTTTPTPTATPPGDDDDDHHHGNHHGHGHDDGHNGNGHHNGGNHGNHHDDDDEHGNGHHGNKKNKGKGKDKHGSVFFLPDSDDMRTGTTALVLTFCGLLLASTLRQPAGRRALVVRLTSLGLAGTLALQGCLIGNIDAGPNTSVEYTFSYDNLSQLIGVNINQTPAASFSFDLAGNLLSLTVGNTTTAQTFNALNQKTTPGTNLYDAKGQTTDQDGRTFEWDDDGRMTAIVDGTHRSEFAYDGYGRRIKIAEFDNGNLTSKKLYWWLGGQIVCERDGIDPGFPITKRYFGQGVQVGAERLYYTFDQLGSVRELVDANGVVRADYRYSTYGERTKVAGDLDSDWSYAGLWHHGPSGLDLATHRTYDSKAGRWISRDPLGEGVDYNLYRYCGNNPISCVDPLGLVTNKNPFPPPSGKRKPVEEEGGYCGPTREDCEERRERRMREFGGSPTRQQWDEIWKDYWDCLKMVFEYERDYEIERQKKPGYNPYRDPRHPENFDHERALQYDRARRP